jgi:hypothetical protein
MSASRASLLSARFCSQVTFNLPFDQFAFTRLNSKRSLEGGFEQATNARSMAGENHRIRLAVFAQAGIVKAVHILVTRKNLVAEVLLFTP